ncbi:hypothetical protein PMZ80_005679 [Knufia obscura]|uniref:Uncharacterized protein n=2 Tax=Knufia TaxID=430999 RepID=A0AAN8F113_9EURO|nr:hypothetical protein PMZ80_005679 [Knufia obscura]KAK5949436.1 hypothetical protein OHC33_009610 [Knufia fluminis]
MDALSNNTTSTTDSIVHDTTHGFFSLPREMRNYIYWLILQPMSSGVLESTKVLSLCRQSHEEAIVYLKPCVPMFRLGQGQRSLFRYPKANGKVNLFQSTSRTSKCYQYQRFSELEVVRATTIQLTLSDASSGPGYPLVMKKTAEDAIEVAQVIRKSTHLETLEIAIGSWRPGSNPPLQAQILAAYLSLISACKQMQAKIII